MPHPIPSYFFLFLLVFFTPKSSDAMTNRLRNIAMTNSPDHDTSTNALLFLMTNMSPAVRDAIETESYRNKADSDGATPEYILEDAFTHLLKDLETIGLTFAIDMSDYVEDYNKLSMFLELGQLLLPNTLYDILKKDHTVKTLVEHVLSGCLDNDTTTIQVYLSEIAGLDGGLPLKEHLVDFIDQLYPLVTQTEVFSDYLRNLLALNNEERPSPNTDPDRHIAYSEKLKAVIGDLADAVNLFSKESFYPELVSYQNLAIRDFLIPDHFTDYAYLLLEDKAQLPEELRELFDRKWYQYFASHPWNFEYYLVRNTHQAVSEVQQVIVICFAYAICNSNTQMFQTLLVDLQKYHPDSAVMVRIVQTLLHGD